MEVTEQEEFLQEIDLQNFYLNVCIKQKCLIRPNSTNLNDGLKLKNVYMTPVLKCVPPNDKPKAEELKKCFKYLRKEFDLLKNATTLLALGKDCI